MKPLLRYFSCVLRVIVLLEGKPSAQSEVLSTLEKVFFQDIPVLGRIHRSLDCNPVVLSLQLKNTPHSIMLPPPCFTVGTVLEQVMSRAWFSPNITLRMRAKSSILSHQTRESYLSPSWSPSGFFSKLHAGFHVSCTEKRLPSGHSAIKPMTGGGLQ